MTSRVRHLIAAFALAASLTVPASAGADVLSDCVDGSLSGDYSEAEKKAALQNIPSDLDEYSDCRAVISGALGGGAANPKAGAASNGAVGGAAAPDSPEAVAQRKRAAKVRKARKEKAKAEKIRELAGKVNAADDSNKLALSAADTTSDLPTGLLLALIALGLLALAGGFMTLHRRVPAFGEALRRVPFPRRRG